MAQLSSPRSWSEDSAVMDGLKANTDLVHTSHFIPLKLAVKLGGAGSLQEEEGSCVREGRTGFCNTITHATLDTGGVTLACIHILIENVSLSFLMYNKKQVH